MMLLKKEPPFNRHNQAMRTIGNDIWLQIRTSGLSVKNNVNFLALLAKKEEFCLDTRLLIGTTHTSCRPRLVDDHPKHE